MKISNIKKWSTEKLSQSIFYVLVGFAVITFFLFFFVGYDMPFEENPDFNAPFFTNLLLVTMWIFFLLALCLAIYSFVRAGKRKSKGEMKMNGIPAGNIVWITWGGTLALLVLTFVLGSSGMILINTRPSVCKSPSPELEPGIGLFNFEWSSTEQRIIT